MKNKIVLGMLIFTFIVIVAAISFVAGEKHGMKMIGTIELANHMLSLEGQVAVLRHINKGRSEFVEEIMLENIDRQIWFTRNLLNSGQTVEGELNRSRLNEIEMEVLQNEPKGDG